MSDLIENKQACAKSKHLVWLDMAKGIAIFLVVMGHVLMNDIYNYNNYMELSPLSKFVNSIQMPLFSFLSGFVVSIKVNIKKWIYGRFRSLLVPFIIFSLIYVIIYRCSPLDYYSQTYKNGLWYLISLFYWNILFVLLSHFVNKVGRFDYLVYLSFICIDIILLYFTRYIPTIDGYLSLSVTLSYFPYFLIGNYVKRKQLLERRAPLKLMVIICVFLLISYLLTYKYNYLRYITGVSGVLLIIILCKKCRDTQPLIRIMSYLGLNSMFIYIFHIFCLSIFKFVKQYTSFIIGKQSLVLDFAMSVIPTVSIIVITILIAMIFNKLPRLKHLIFYR